MAPPKRNFWRQAISIRSAGPASTAPSGQPRPFERQSVTVSTRDPIAAGRNAEGDGGVHQPGAVHVDADTRGPGDGDDGVELVERPHAPARDVVRVLDDEHGRPLVDDVLDGRRCRLHLGRRHPAGDSRQADGEEPRMGGCASELVDEDVRVLLGEEHVAGPAVQLEGDLVRHRRGRKKDRAVVSEQLGRALLELVDGRILAHLLVTDDGGGDGGTHPRRRSRNGVGAKIDHGRPFCTGRRARWYVRRHDRDRRGRVGRGQGGAAVRASRGVDARHAGACGTRVDDLAGDARDRPGHDRADRHRRRTRKPTRSCCGRRSRRLRATRPT